MIIGVGVDIVDIRRMRRALERQDERFVRRLFTPAEAEFCRRHHDPVPYFAVRFAAKEALFKALGTGWSGGVSWLEVEVTREEQQAPSMTLTGKAEELSRSLGARTVHVSLSHSDESAVAIVILEK
ncbi:MAG: holo-ACP synthase [Acidobacteria bacterium]|nr:holo-ACP synthase [Acidobacteriota bacterium]